MAEDRSRIVDEILEMFAPRENVLYLDSATYGLPPRPTLEALTAAQEGWRTGEARWIDDWDRQAEDCRRLAAQLMAVGERQVALLPTVSMATSIVATAVPQGGEVLMPESEFTSVVYPFLTAGRDLKVREVPLQRLADAIGPKTAMVAVSAIQSADGQVADLEAIGDAARKHGAKIYVDTSQSLGVRPIDATRLGIDFLSCSAYKWLCCPRGVAFLYVRPELLDEAQPLAASWRAGDDPYGRYYGTPLALADDAGRFDQSLAWHAWVGARQSLQVLCSIDDDTRLELAMAPTRRLAELLSLPEPESSILALEVTDGAAEALAEANIKVSVRAGRVRVSSHFYNRVSDAERAAEVLRPFVPR